MNQSATEVATCQHFHIIAENRYFSVKLATPISQFSFEVRIRKSIFKCLNMSYISVTLLLVASFTLTLGCPIYPPYNTYPVYNGYDQVQGGHSEYRNLDQIQAANPYEISSRQRRPITYGPIYLTNYGKRPYHYGRPRSSGNQLAEGEYLLHSLLANQIGGPNNDHMAQLIYDNSNQPQQVPSRSVMQQSNLYPGLYDRYMGYNLYEDANNYYLMPTNC